ncbi:hypothetical protein J3R82DRAFT_6433 [Butyriboletus roseoflavus]|nr:hypothetical protein J3R82DRAFT_6433 [Butyriboletus roseoflavus]
MESRDYEGAIQLFERARNQMQYYVGPPLLSISLISGWKFDDLGIRIQQRLCEALCLAGRTKEGGEALLKMVNTFDEEINTCGHITKWVSDFTQQCLSAPAREGDATSKVAEYDNLPTPLDSPIPIPLLREWAKSTLASGEWRAALVAAVRVSISFCSGIPPESNTAGLEFTLPRPAIFRVICERLETIDHITDAIECLQQMVNELAGGKDAHGEQAKWVLDFKQRCAEKLARFGDDAADAQRHDDAIIQYSTALSLNPASPQDFFNKRSREYVAKWLWEYALDDTTQNHQVITLDPLSPWGYENVLTEWAKVNLTDGSWGNALTTAGSVPRLVIYRVVCERLETVDRVMDAIECFHEMENELVQEIQGKEVEWALDFKSRCCRKIEDLGDDAMNTGQYDEATSQYSAALSLNPTAAQALFVKRSKARAARGLWEDALSDANEAISLDPSSPFGYESKYVASRGAGHHKDTLQAFEIMLLKMAQSPDLVIHGKERCRQYTKTRGVVRKAVQDAIRESPRVLINTTSGRLCDKSEQAAAFELSPVFTELISAMTTHIDHFRIEQEVGHYYRYATFSHKWEDNELLFEKVIHAVVYDLEESPTHGKLQMYCKIVWDAGFHWAWSDTCCINKADHFVLQEALVAMFKWYHGSALTIIFLRGVRSPSQRGDLVRSIWNTRAWTFQEYHASKVVRFYTEDWTLYMNLDIPNHKESPKIISEMEEATGVSARALTALQPGLNDIREKLCLASKRETTFVEDAAYSLLGIFSISLPVIYGEGEKALGRLLAQLLTGSGDTNILAWTGRSGNFNSCLPADITVFNELPTSYISPTIDGPQMGTITSGLLASPLNLTLIMKLYDQLDQLPVPFFVGQRMKLPCIIFKLGALSASRSRSGHVFRTQTAALGIVKIRTKEDLSRLDSLYLVHPWIDFLLDRQPVGSVTEAVPEENAGDQSSSISELQSSPGSSNITLAAPQTQAARLAARCSPWVVA